MNIEVQLEQEIDRARARGDLNLESTLMLARHTIRTHERALDIKEEKLKDLRQQIRGARGLLELRRERIEDLMRELGQETEEA